MSTLTIQTDDAVLAFKNGDAAQKKLLANLFPKAQLHLLAGDCIKTVDEALALDGGWSEEDEKWLQAVKHATIVARVLNQGWTPDYSNDKQPKWYVWMQYDKSLSAFRFDITYHDYSDANTVTGSRHAFKDAITAKFFAEAFGDLLNQILLH